MLFYNFDNYDFWPIYNCIRNFYPIGIAKPDQNVFEYFPGTQELIKVVEENIHNELNFKHRWLDFLSNAELQIGKRIKDTTYGQAPSFNCVIELEQSEQSDFKRIKELHLSVSLVGPFYCIIGRDRNEIKSENDLIRSVNYLVVSPEHSFSDIFLKLCKLVEDHFTNFKFVPFYVNKMEIRGIQIHYTVEKREQVFQALFTDQLSITNYIQGDEYFQFQRWEVENLSDKKSDTWSIIPPLGSIW